MEIAFLISFVAFLLCFLTTLIALRLIISQTTLSSTSPWKNDAFLPALSITCVSFVAFFFLRNSPQDQIFPLKLTELLIALTSSIAIYAFFFFKQSIKTNLPLLSALVCLSTALLPTEFMLFQNHLPFWADRLCIIALWTTFAWCFHYLNGIDGMTSLQASNMVAGLFIVSILGGLPLLYGHFSASFLGALLALLIYNWYPAKLMLSNGACLSLGFLIGWLFLLSAREGMSGCSLVFSVYYILEIFWALGNKLVSDKGDFVANTLYYQTNISGLSPAEVCQNINKLLMILLIIGCFQIYAPNNYSLPLTSAFITLWFMSKLNNWQTQGQTLKEINQEVIQDIKDNINDIKKIIR